MATQTTRSTRTGRPSSSTANRGRFARGTATPRRTTPTQGLRRRKPQQSGLQKVMGAVLPTAAAKKATPSSKKGKAGAGAALAAAAAGMAFAKRGKLTQKFRKDDDAGMATTTSPVHTANHNPDTGSPPSTPTI